MLYSTAFKFDDDDGDEDDDIDDDAIDDDAIDDGDIDDGDDIDDDNDDDDYDDDDDDEGWCMSFKAVKERAGEDERAEKERRIEKRQKNRGGEKARGRRMTEGKRGVAQVINRIDGLPFDEHDDQLFEAFAIFCGLGINNCQLYEQVSVSAARQAVALEVLSYHSAVPMEEVTRLKHQKLPDVNQTKLREFTFNDFLLDNDEMALAAIKMFQELGLMRKFKIEQETFCRWILTVRKNYRNVPYHNFRHAFNVCQVMFVIMQQCQCRGYLTDNETLALVVACLCHDLDHRGTNNAYQQKSSSALSQLYGTKATLEHHHFNHAIMILNSGVSTSWTAGELVFCAGVFFCFKTGVLI
ncbi:phosphodiesterase [Elysia marginata]|uniref:Phosphodiesterase n=1 Tax=Elysia marginata TaxID=1093978 RepID=A0AAV4HAS7_9GAST|nr:phosphodiesterase [Elysia marginata]